MPGAVTETVRETLSYAKKIYDKSIETRVMLYGAYHTYIQNTFSIVKLIFINNLIIWKMTIKIFRMKFNNNWDKIIILKIKF